MVSPRWLLDEQFIPRTTQPEHVPDTGPWLVFSGDRLLVERVGEGATLPTARPELPLQGERYLGELNGQPVRAARLDGEPPADSSFTRLRSLYGRLPDALWALGGYAHQILEFHRTHGYCGYCATPTDALGHEQARKCPNCGLTVYPRLAPVAMVLVTRRGESGELELLLSRSPHFPPGMYSATAGFVEPGETVEGAAAREAYEELGVQIKNLRYFASQPWPFPHSLMIAYSAQWDGGQIALQPEEIEDAQWFPLSKLPPLPLRASIARSLIEHVLATDGQA